MYYSIRLYRVRNLKSLGSRYHSGFYAPGRILSVLKTARASVRTHSCERDYWDTGVVQLKPKTHCTEKRQTYIYKAAFSRRNHHGINLKSCANFTLPAFSMASAALAGTSCTVHYYDSTVCNTHIMSHYMYLSHVSLLVHDT